MTARDPLDTLADTIERELSRTATRLDARLSDDELAEVIADCEQCPHNAHGTDREATVWRWLHSLAVEVRDARAGAR